MILFMIFAVASDFNQAGPGIVSGGGQTDFLHFKNINFLVFIFLKYFNNVILKIFYFIF